MTALDIPSTASKGTLAPTISVLNLTNSYQHQHLNDNMSVIILMWYNSIHKSRIKYGILTILRDSFSPFHTGLRRNNLFQRLLREYEPGLGAIPHDHIASFNMRFQRILDSLVKDGILIRDSKGHKRTFYRLNKDEYVEFLDDRGEIDDKRKFSESLAREILQSSEFLRLPPISLLIGESMFWGRLGEWGFSEFKQQIVDRVIEYIEPQIKEQWDVMENKDNVTVRDGNGGRFQPKT